VPERAASAHDGWRDGWWTAARASPSPNHGPRPLGQAVDLVVLHAISLPPGCYGGPEVEDLFLNRLDTTRDPRLADLAGLQVSAHFFIRRDGECVQFVAVDRRAWHAGVSQFQGRSGCNDFSVGIELEGCDTEGFEPAQMRTLTRLLRALRRVCPLRAITGHEHIAPGRKTDPGPGFDWRALRRRLRWSPRWFPDVATD
jgi:AmpD protein